MTDTTPPQNAPAATPAPRKKISKKIGCLILVVLFIVIIMVVAAGDDDNDENRGTISSPAASEQAQKVYGLNEPAPSKDVVWTVTDVKNRGNTLKASESRYAAIAKDKTTPGKFVELTLTVENKGTDLASITDPKVKDSQGRSFTSATGVSEWLPEGQELFLLENLQPNLPKQLTFIFEVPADATGLQLEVGVFEPKLINLGL